MRWRQSRESQNVQDYRGRSTGGGRGFKFGIGGIVVLIAGYFLGVDPRLIMGLMSGGDTTQAEPEIEAGAPTDEGGQFVAHILGDTEQTWTEIFAQAGGE